MNRGLLILIILLALAAGVFYRLAQLSGVGSFREYGLIFLLLIGIIGTLAAHRGQAEKGMNAAFQQLQAVPGRKLRLRSGLPEHPDQVVIRPEGVLAIFLSDLSQSAARSGVVRRLRKEAHRAETGAVWLAGELSLPAVKVLPLVVLTRRRLSGLEGEVWKQEQTPAALTDGHSLAEAVEACFEQLAGPSDAAAEAAPLDVEGLAARLKSGCGSDGR